VLERLTFERELQSLAIAPPPSAAEIIDADDRTPAFTTLQVPYRWICALELYVTHPRWGGGGPRWQETGRGTGVLIDADRVLTAAHLLSSLEDGKVRPIERIVIVPGRNGRQRPFGSAQARRWRTAAAWDALRRPWAADYAVLVLDKPLGRERFKALGGQPLGWWGSAAHGHDTALGPEIPTDWLTGKPITCAGYPGDTCGTDRLAGKTAAETRRAIERCRRERPELWAAVPWWSAGVVRAVHPSGALLHHTADTYGGQSGAPVWIWQRRDGRRLRRLVGIHVAPGALRSGGGSRYTDNLAVRIRAPVLAEIAGLR
jgi:V8-like Glu-specific endopeptidase